MARDAATNFQFDDAEFDRIAIPHQRRGNHRAVHRRKLVMPRHERQRAAMRLNAVIWLRHRQIDAPLVVRQELVGAREPDTDAGHADAIVIYEAHLNAGAPQRFRNDVVDFLHRRDRRFAAHVCLLGNLRTRRGNRGVFVHLREHQRIAAKLPHPKQDDRTHCCDTNHPCTLHHNRSFKYRHER